MNGDALIQVNQVVKRFGGITALSGVSLSLKQGSIMGIIGPNGAGKTTLGNVINGLYRPDEGIVLLDGSDITGLAAHRITLLGLGRTFQITRLFKNLTVLENIMIPALKFYSKRSEALRRVLLMVELFELTRIKDELAGEISGGQQKLVELARANVHDPQLLLLDEPFYGIHPELKKKIIDLIKMENQEGKTFLLISHDMPSVRAVCDSVLVMNAGKVIFFGSPDEARKVKEVVEAYLGV